MPEDRAAYRKLIVWQRADELALAIYLATKRFPSEELYGVTSQLRRAALSIPTNIVEGSARQGQRELKRFVSIALGSLAEVEYLVNFSCRLGYLTTSQFEELDGIRRRVGSLLWKFYLSL